MLTEHAQRTFAKAGRLAPNPMDKGKLIGSKPALRTKDVRSIRTKLQAEKRTRDLALFNLAIDSKLRGCDAVNAQPVRDGIKARRKHDASRLAKGFLGSACVGHP
jgi:hypothetical protein